MSVKLLDIYFLKMQRYNSDTTVYQDNQSAILLETNGIRSSTKKTKHMRVRYFFLRDRVNAGDLEIKYCPTEEMIADLLTKQLQEKLFRKFRSMIINVSPEMTDAETGSPPANMIRTVEEAKNCPQECVGVRDNRTEKKEKLEKDRRK